MEHCKTHSTQNMPWLVVSAARCRHACNTPTAQKPLLGTYSKLGLSLKPHLRCTTLQTRSECVLQELLGVVADLQWDTNTTEALILTAACSLPASTPLTPALTAVGADPDHLIMTHGLAALSGRRAHKAGQRQQAVQSPLQGQGSVQMPWLTPDAASFQLCIEPPEEDECRKVKLQLLAASALGTVHALMATSSQVRPVITHNQCCCLGPHIQVALECFTQHTNAVSTTSEQTFLVICVCKGWAHHGSWKSLEYVCKHRRLHWASLQPQKRCFEMQLCRVDVVFCDQQTCCICGLSRDSQ